MAQDGLVALVVSTLLCAPMLVHRYSNLHRAFFNDWQNHLYLVARQASYLEAHDLLPTYFLNTARLGWFYPFYAFYGGTLYYLTGLGAWAVGSPWAAYVSSYVLATLAAFLGWTWLARQARVPGWLAYLPGAVFVGGAFYLSVAYGLGDWPEFVAPSSLAFVLAAAWSVATRSRLAPLDAAALIGAVVVLTGSHPVTLMLAPPFLVATFGVLLLLRRRPAVSLRRLAAVGGLTALGVGLNGWFLVPLLAYRNTVQIQAAPLGLGEFDHLGVIFSLLSNNPVPNATPHLYIQAPDLPLLAAGLVTLAGVLFVRGWRQRLLAASVVGGFALVLVLTVGPASIWQHLPSEALYIQFRYRLNMYLLACIAGLMLVACRYAGQIRALHPRAGRLAFGLLAGAALMQAGFALSQVWSAQVVGSAESVLDRPDQLPATWYDSSFLDRALPLVTPSTTERLSPDLTTLNQSSVVITVPAHLTGRYISVDVIPSPLITFSLAALAGQDGDGHAVVHVPESPSDVQITVQGTATWATLAGTATTVLCLLGALASVGLLLLRRRGARHQVDEPAPQMRPQPRIP